MRIIAGRWGGRTLRAPRGATTRPTTDRVREALFSLLGDISGARVLDLYAGSGALGLEALSRGASSVVFVESQRAAIACIQANIESLDAGPAAVLIPDRVERSRSRLDDLAPFDLLLCDPPWPAMGRSLLASKRLLDLMAPEGTLVVEHPARESLPSEILGRPSDIRRYGDTALSLFAVR